MGLSLNPTEGDKEVGSGAHLMLRVKLVILQKLLQLPQPLLQLLLGHVSVGLKEEPSQIGLWVDKRQSSMNIPGRLVWSPEMVRLHGVEELSYQTDTFLLQHTALLAALQQVFRSYWANTEPMMMCSHGWMSLRSMMTPTIPSLMVTSPF